MYDTLFSIYKFLHGDTPPLELKRIVRQKSSSYQRKSYIQEKFNPEILQLLNDGNYIKLLNGEIMILPLGYAYIYAGLKQINVNNDHYLFVMIYQEMCDQILEPLLMSSLSEIESSIGFMLLLTGSVTNGWRFPFIKSDKTYVSFTFIKEYIEYICFRLFQTNSQIKNETILRNILGRNNKNGNLIKETHQHRVEIKRSLGTTYHWFEINHISNVDSIVDALWQGKKDMIGLLNLKKMAQDNLLLDPVPSELKLEYFDKGRKKEILNHIISMINQEIEVVKEIEDTHHFSIYDFNYDFKYNDLLLYYELLTAQIEAKPRKGFYLIEIHYRLSKLIKHLDNIEMFDVAIRYEKEQLGEDFDFLLSEAINNIKNY